MMSRVLFRIIIAGMVFVAFGNGNALVGQPEDYRAETAKVET